MVYKPLLAAFLAASVANVDSRRLLLGRGQEKNVEVGEWEVKKQLNKPELTGQALGEWNAINKPESVVSEDDSVSVLSEDDSVSVLSEDDSVSVLSETTIADEDDTTEVPIDVDPNQGGVLEEEGTSRKLLEMTKKVDLKDNGAGLKDEGFIYELLPENALEHVKGKIGGGQNENHHHRTHPCHPENGASGEHACEDPHDHGDINKSAN